nr:MAG TPA: hypothetical protein [Caudoviricetes sp.]
MRPRGWRWRPWRRRLGAWTCRLLRLRVMLSWW